MPKYALVGTNRPPITKKVAGIAPVTRNVPYDNYSDAEIERLAAKEKWDSNRSISFNDIKTMTAPELRFYELHSQDVLDAALRSSDKPNQKFVKGENEK